MENEKRIGIQQALERLKGGIAPAERAALENDCNGLVLSRFNRATLLRMLETDSPREARDIDLESLEGLKGALQNYLSRYMPEHPEGHKWIILSCLFLAFIVREPMHPQEIVGWRNINGRYLCPAREASGESLCRWCVCRGEE